MLALANYHSIKVVLHETSPKSVVNVTGDTPE
jgi:hypothetical protein